MQKYLGIILQQDSFTFVQPPAFDKSTTSPLFQISEVYKHPLLAVINIVVLNSLAHS